MRILGIVCEYNPFHRGHLLHLQRCCEAAGEESAVVCCMSGDFVQRGEAAIFSKRVRAEAACRAGADLVLELPLPWCLSSAEGFARGGVGLLGALGAEMLGFGSETGETEPLQELAALLGEADFPDAVRARLKREPGLSFAAAREREAQLRLGDTALLLEQPNNILAVEYLKAVRSLSLSMEPLAVRREGSGHDEEGGELRSASAIRRSLRAGESVEGDLPPEALAVYKREREKGRALPDPERLETAILSRLLALKEADFSALPDAADGLDRRLYRALREEKTLEAVCAAAQTRRFPLARVRRACLSAALGVRDGMAAGTPPYARVLAANARGRALLRERTGKTAVPILTKPAAVRELDADSVSHYTLGADAHDFYGLAFPADSREKPEQDWRDGPVIV